MFALVLTGGTDRSGKPIDDLVIEGVEWVAVTYDDNPLVVFVDEREEQAVALGWEQGSDARRRVLNLDTNMGTFKSWKLVEQLEGIPLKELLDLISQIESDRFVGWNLAGFADLIEEFSPEAAKYLRERV